MRRGHLTLALIALLPCLAGAQEPVVALTNATVVDVARGALVRDRTILTRAGRIEQVGPAASTRIPRGAVRVDVAGQFVIPGLWDMHVHLVGNTGDDDVLANYYGSLFLANGVTGVRDAGAPIERLRALDSIARSGKGRMPRMVYAGGKVGPQANGSWTIADARTAIDERIRSGAQYVKLVPVYPEKLLIETYAICAAVRLKCVAHLPPADTALWLSVPGRGSYEHLFGLAEHTSREPAGELFAAAREYDQPTLRQRILYKLRLRRRPGDPRVQRLAMRDTSRDAGFFSRVASSGTWITPTLVLHHQIERATDILPAAVDTNLSRTPLPPTRRDSAARAVNAGLWRLHTGLVRGMARAGVALLAGTDFSTFHVPGAVLNAELQFLQQAGLPAVDVLRMATTNPARYLGAADTLGAVAPGYVADLVVLRRNPLDDIRHVADVEMVMTRGHLLRRSALDSLTRAARSARDRIRPAGRGGPQD